MTDDKKPKSNKGFASMSPEKRRKIASQGGKAVPDEKRSFSLDPELASIAGALGGARARRGKKKKISADETDSRS
jgi:general stress protein YciG